MDGVRKNAVRPSTLFSENSTYHNSPAMTNFLVKSGAFYSHLQPLGATNMYMGYQGSRQERGNDFERVPHERFERKFFLFRRLLLRPYIMTRKQSLVFDEFWSMPE